MKHLSMLAKSSFVCGIIATVAMLCSCGTAGSLSSVKAAQRLAQSPISSVYSHNDVNTPNLRDCYEAGPLPERTRRALITWLHDSEIKEFSYVRPQYYVTTTGPDGKGETVWALCSDGKGNLVGVLVPRNRNTPAWELPTIGSYRLHVCKTSERETLSNAIMESLADVGYDRTRIAILKASGVTETRHLISKPLDIEQQKLIKDEEAARAKALKEAKDKARKEDAEQFGKSSSSSGSDEGDDNTTESDDTSSDDTSSDESDSSSDSSSDDDTSSDESDSSDSDTSSSDDEDDE